MMTANKVFILPPPESVGRRCVRRDSRRFLLSTERLGDQGVDPGEVRADVSLALDREGRIPPEPVEQGLEDPFDRGGVDQPDAHPIGELSRKRVRPLREGVELRLEVVREGRVRHLPLDLLPEPHDLPGHFAVLSVVVLGRDVGDDLDADQPLQGRCRHRRASSDERLTAGDGCRDTTIGWHRDQLRGEPRHGRRRLASAPRPGARTPTGRFDGGTRPVRFADRPLAPVWEKVQAGDRLSREDGLRLFETDDLLGLGRMAGLVKSRREGDRVYFVINRYISPTNICVLSCAFCGFARKKGEDGAFEYTIEDIVGMVGEEVREVHIVGGHHPDWPFEYYERVIAALRAARPEVQIKAFTAAEIDYFWRRWRIEPGEALSRLKAAGLQTMPGGGAEIFSARVAKLLRYSGKADPERWCEIHGIAHALGIKTNATMLYGHVETLAERVDHLLRLRAQQDASGGFLTFIPLPYQVGTTRVVPRPTPPTDKLRTTAVARLLLDNFPHVEAYWVLLGEATASVALHFGADDVNGTLEHERVQHMAGAQTPAGLAREQLCRMIRDAGKVPVERDALYNVLQVWN